MEGKRFGDYRVLGEIARGGQGAVVRAVREADGQPVALKLLLDKNPKHVARFRQEARVLAQLSHPNLIRILDHGSHNGLPYIVMELVDGEDLGAIAEREPVEPGWAVDVAGAIASALQHCHDHGVVHRDVKPANILIEAGSQRPVLVDFGLIKRDPDRLSVGSLGVSRLSKTGELRGTPTFMAPEQINPGKYGPIAPTTDVYALGATLFAVLTGEPPFVADHLPGILAQIIGEDPPDPRSRRPSLDPGLGRFVRRCLAKNPAERPPSARAFAAELAASLGGGARGSRTPVALGLLGVSLVLAALAVGAWRLRAEADPPARAEGPRASQTQPVAPSEPAEPVLDEAALARGDRELNRLKRLEDPRQLAEEARSWLGAYARHPRASEAEALLARARVRFPERTLEGYAGYFVDDGHVVGFRGTPKPAVLLWDLEGNEPQEWALPWHISAIALRPDGKQLAMGGWGREIIIMDLPSGEVAVRYPYDHQRAEDRQSIRVLAFSPNGALLAVGGCRVQVREDRTYEKDRFEGRVLDARSGEARCVLSEVRSEIGGFAFVGEDRLLVARGTTILREDLAGLPLANALALHSLEDGALLREEHFTSRPNFLSVHPDGRVMTGTNGGRILLCEASGRVERAFSADDVSFNKTGPRFLISAQDKAVRDAVFVDGGERFYTVAGESNTQEGEFALWDTASGERLRRVDVGRYAWALDLSPNGERLLVSAFDGLELWPTR